MKRDDLHLIIRNDSSLLLYGAIQMETKDEDRCSDIKYSLRVLSRLLIKFRKISQNPNARSQSLILPENYDFTLQAAKEISGYKSARNIKVPTTFNKIGFCLKNLALYERAVALKENSSIMYEKIRNILELYETDWQVYASNCKAVYQNEKANIPEELPLEEDVKAFRSYCMDQIKRMVKIIKDGEFTTNDVKNLAKVTSARLMTFNARRGGEVSKPKLSHWQGVEDNRWKRRTDVDALSDPVEKKLAERMGICYLPGKRKKGGNNELVPILFTCEVTAAIRLLVENRSCLSADPNNKYVFTCGISKLRGWDTLQAITKKITNLQKPTLITPTRTRKLLATMLQLLDMTDAELTWVTNHFGHTKNVHFAWYR